MKTIGRIALVGLCLAGSPGQTQEDVEDPPRYAVEILVFQHLDQTRSTQEMPPPPNPLAGEVPPARFTAPGPALEFVLLDPLTGGAGFAELAPDDMSLGDAWGRLERLDAYLPLAYLSWSQPARPRVAAQPLPVGNAGAAPPGLSGQVTLYKERFLHLALDLAWQESPGATQSLNPVAPPAAYIDESRRLTSDLVQYFDNPRFGAIAYVRQLEIAAPEAAAAEPQG